MKINVKFDYTSICKAVLQDQLDALNLDYRLINLGEIEFKKGLNTLQKEKLTQAFTKYGIEVLGDSQSILVQRIKDCITTLINDVEKSKKHNVSDYLSSELHYSYSYLSNVFSEVTHSSIENFVILKKIDLAKQLIINQKLTLTEIAYKLNYSSVAHLSTQFKKTTGLTPSAFQRIIKKRQEREDTAIKTF